MGFKPPIGRGVHAGGSEGALDAQLLFPALNILHQRFERGEVIHLIQTGDLGAL